MSTQPKGTVAITHSHEATDSESSSLKRAAAVPDARAPPQVLSALVELPDDRPDLGLAEHLEQLTRLALTPANHVAHASVAAALEVSVRSLTACEAQHAHDLTSDIAALRDEYRQKLEALEAEFVRKAETLSAELASTVAERKHHHAEALCSHADTLRESLRQRVAAADERDSCVEERELEESADGYDAVTPVAHTHGDASQMLRSGACHLSGSLSRARGDAAERVPPEDQAFLTPAEDRSADRDASWWSDSD